MNLDYSPVLGEDVQPAGVIAIVVETTERVLADRRAAAEQERQRQLFRKMPGFVAVLAGPEHVYEYVNDAYVEDFGARATSSAGASGMCFRIWRGRVSSSC